MLFLICFLIFPLTVYADLGPKDLLTVYVENPPEGLYYLDLLTKEGTQHSSADIKDNVQNYEMYKLLYRYEDKGWLPALAGGKSLMIGSLTGKRDGSRMVHQFTYREVPKTYRIIIVTEDGDVRATDEYTRKALQSSIIYNYATQNAETPSVLATYLVQFAITFTFTLLIEGILLLAFRISLRKNWKPFLAVNFVTQILLTFTVGVALMKDGPMLAFFIQVPTEIVILIAETGVYQKIITGVNIQRKTAYAIAANLASWLGGLFLLDSLFNFLVRIL